MRRRHTVVVVATMVATIRGLPRPTEAQLFPFPRLRWHGTLFVRDTTASFGLLVLHLACRCLPFLFFRDFCVPQAPAALLKSALICAGIVTLPAALSSPKSAKTTAELELSAGKEPSAVAGKTDTDSGETDSLQKQLGRIFGHGGIRVTSRSDLPQGSGMGTSSILAGEGKRVIYPVTINSVVQRAGCIQ